MIYPLFYPRFHCLASRCGHTCCRGWEICVDEESAKKYRALPGPLGDELRKNLIKTEDGVQFRMTSEEACPFLTERGLCRLIQTGGADLLCEICAAHPRFFGSVNGKDYCGLGLSCEAAVSLLLSPGPLRFADGNRKTVCAFPALCSAVGVKFSPADLRFQPETEPDRMGRFLRLLRSCEPIDDRWAPSVGLAAELLPQTLTRAAALWNAERRAQLQKIYEYILYRRLEDAADFSPSVCARFARYNAAYVWLEAVRTGDLAESLRRWSEEIEYSDENVTKLLSALRRQE